MNLYVEGDNHKLGYAVSREYSDPECGGSVAVSEVEKPARFYAKLRRDRRVVARCNGRRPLPENQPRIPRISSNLPRGEVDRPRGTGKHGKDRT